jgi:hypothetical protein
MSDTHSFYEDPDLALKMNADLDPGKTLSILKKSVDSFLGRLFF